MRKLIQVVLMVVLVPLWVPMYCLYNAYGIMRDLADETWRE